MIKETLLNTVTETVLAKINQARLNDNQIVAIQKQREQRFVFIDFLVPDSIKEINKIELLDDSNAPQSVIDVYVPIETTTRFKYRLEVLTDG